LPGVARDGGWIVAAHPRLPFGVVRFEGAHYDRRLASMNECLIYTWPYQTVACIFEAGKADSGLEDYDSISCLRRNDQEVIAGVGGGFGRFVRRADVTLDGQ